MGRTCTRTPPSRPCPCDLEPRWHALSPVKWTRCAPTGLKVDDRLVVLPAIQAGGPQTVRVRTTFDRPGIWPLSTGRGEAPFDWPGLGPPSRRTGYDLLRGVSVAAEVR